jgi:lysozyme
MLLDALKNDLSRDEGIRLYVYDDANGKPITKGSVVVGHPTIGIGRLLTSARGISKSEAMALLDNDLAWVFDDLDRNCPWWRRMPEPAQRGLANMALNLGWPRLSAFRNMLAALQAMDYATAAREALDSKWAKQVGARAERIAALYREAGK